MLAGGLYRTGVANVVGRHVLRLAGGSPVRVTAVTIECGRTRDADADGYTNLEEFLNHTDARKTD